MVSPNIMPVQASINTSKKKQQTAGFFQYPSNLGSHAMLFSFMKYNRNKLVCLIVSPIEYARNNTNHCCKLHL